MVPEGVHSHLPKADALIVVPPFGGLDRPSLGVHVLQACAREWGFEVAVLYSNVLLAREIGEAEYGEICFASTSNLLGERFFAPTAYGVGTEVSGTGLEGSEHRQRKSHVPPMGWKKFSEHAAKAGAWADALAAEIAKHDYPVVGFTTTFEQTAASVALLERLKRLRPETLILMGGANCEGEMAEGILSLSPHIDFVFSGESEASFPAFLSRVRDGDLPDSPVVEGSPNRELDGVPTPDFSEYYAQHAGLLPESRLRESESIWLPYESSRGCWWGEKKHCTFCGINGQGMVFRQKSPDRVVEELQVLLKAHPTNKICMVDNIMPHQYFKTLLPRLAEEVPDIHMFYEQKANLTFERVSLLKSAGVAVIQPGIEALSTPLLRLMKKGVTTAQNIALLRYSKIVELAVNWNLLYAFPGDELRWYEETLELLPLLSHLNPPTSLCHLSIDRFSPYFNEPDEYGIRSSRPMSPYFDVLPEGIDRRKIAYHFEADYDSESRGNGEIVKALEQAIEVWRERWRPEAEARPVLELAALGDDMFLLVDTRGLDTGQEFSFINPAQAAAALAGTRSETTPEALDWALAKRVCVEIDGAAVPLATADPEVLQLFERAPASRRRIERAAAALPVLSNAPPA